MIDPDKVFGPEWQPGPDGLLFRRGARILIFDEFDRLLLIRGHDWGKAERSWWFTVGGGYRREEDARAGVIREAREETGILLGREDVVGPVGERSAVFDFALRTVRQDELFFYARVAGAAVDPAGLTGWETQLLDEYRWWHLDDLHEAQAAGETLYPSDLVPFAKWLVDGWDGTIRQLSGT